MLRRLPSSKTMERWASASPVPYQRKRDQGDEELGGGKTMLHHSMTCAVFLDVIRLERPPHEIVRYMRDHEGGAVLRSGHQ